MTPKEFVRKYHPFALETQRKTGISALFVLAQAALETGWGKSAPGNMFFGVKAGPHVPEHKKQLLRTREVLLTSGVKFPEVVSVRRLQSGKYEYVVKDWFRKYETPEESFTDHAKLFLSGARYRSALSVKGDPYAFADAVAAAGYATAPDYAAALKGVIRTVERAIK